MSALVMVGDTRDMMDRMPAGSVQCVVTSPPYFGLRAYLSDDDPDKVMEIGQEETPQEYVDAMVSVFHSIWRVLHPSGVVFLNLGDSYAGSRAGPQGSLGLMADRSIISQRTMRKADGSFKARLGGKPKDLLMIPSRVAIALQDYGWYIRSQVAWTKNNPMPDSAKDRPTAAWESIFILTKSEQYFWDYEGAKEPAVSTQGSGNKKRKLAGGGERPGAKEGGLAGSIPWQPTEKRNMRNVWQINTVAFPGAHFATFPPEIPRRAIMAATSEAGCCPICRAPHRRIVEKGAPDLEHQRACGGDVTGDYDGQATKDYTAAGAQNASDVKRRILAGMVEKITIGWDQTCLCPPAPPVPCLVLDPFGGSGTTVMVANQMGRDGIMIDLKMEYALLAAKRISGGK